MDGYVQAFDVAASEDAGPLIVVCRSYFCLDQVCRQMSVLRVRLVCFIVVIER